MFFVLSNSVVDADSFFLPCLAVGRELMFFSFDTKNNGDYTFCHHMNHTNCLTFFDNRIARPSIYIICHVHAICWLSGVNWFANGRLAYANTNHRPWAYTAFRVMFFADFCRNLNVEPCVVASAHANYLCRKRCCTGD